jgi:nucleotide-binding universal stress UspA family protein/sporulation protein YlmC with PRC-barrel domain
MFQHVIVPLDGSAIAEKALEYGTGIARCFGARLTLVRAYQGDEQAARTLAMMQAAPGPDGMLDPATVNAVTDAQREEEAQARAYLDQHAHTLSGSGLNVATELVDAPTADAICNLANREPASLVVMCTHGRGGLERLVFGGTAQDVVKGCNAPVLLVRVDESLITDEGQDLSDDINIGADVIGTDGKLGEVRRVIADTGHNRITDLVVKHGGLFGGNERVVPLGHVTRVAGGQVFVNLDTRSFESLDTFAQDRYNAAGEDWPVPDRIQRQDWLLRAAAAEGPMGAFGAPPSDTTPETRPRPADILRPAIAEGMDVIDSTGRKVGEVGEFSIAAESGAPTRITLRRGFIFKQDTELPLEWVQALGDEGVVLKVEKEAVEALGR